MNRRPTHYECVALPAELHQRMSARWVYPHPADECSLWSLEARIGAVVRCLIVGLRSRRSTNRGGSCWRCDRTARIRSGLTAWQRIVCGCVDDGGNRRSRVDRISVRIDRFGIFARSISGVRIRFAVRQCVLLRNDRNGRCGGNEGGEVHYILLCIGRHAGNNERAVDAILLPERYWRAFTWSVISPGITSSPQGRKVGIPFSTMASAYWTVVAVTVRVIFSKAHTLPFAVFLSTRCIKTASAD